MTIQQKLDSFSMVLADHIRSNDQMIKQFEQLQTEVKELQEMEKQPVAANWYDFTEEQIEHLGEIVNNFIDKIVRDLGSTDVHLRENGIEVSVEVDLSSLVEDELPYSLKNNFREYLNDEITEQREEQQQDC